VSEMDTRQNTSNEDGMDRLLRQSMAAPVPSLRHDFDQRLMRELRRSEQPLDRYGRILFLGYGLVSVVVSAVVMHSQGLGWGFVSGTILAPLGVVAIAHAAWRTRHARIHAIHHSQ